MAATRAESPCAGTVAMAGSSVLVTQNDQYRRPDLFQVEFILLWLIMENELLQCAIKSRHSKLRLILLHSQPNVTTLCSPGSTVRKVLVEVLGQVSALERPKGRDMFEVECLNPCKYGRYMSLGLPHLSFGLLHIETCSCSAGAGGLH